MAYTLPQEMMKLSDATLVAHRRVFPGTLRMSPDTLDVIATALSGHITVFGFRSPDGGLSELTEDDHSKGGFRRGAIRFEFRNSEESIIVLAVRKADFERAMRLLLPPRGDPKAPQPQR